MDVKLDDLTELNRIIETLNATRGLPGFPAMMRPNAIRFFIHHYSGLTYGYVEDPYDGVINLALSYIDPPIPPIIFPDDFFDRKPKLRLVKG